MSVRGRRFGVALVVVTMLLFAGRWSAGLLAERWWVAEAAPAATPFLMQLRLLTLVIDAAGVLIASGWFIGHLLIIHRAVGSVQVPRHVADLEFRETVTPRVLLSGAVVAGAVLGLLVGVGVSDAWPTMALAWHGVTIGVREPLLGHDAGLYVAQLPLWRALHAFALLLVATGTAGVLTLYIVVGAVRWIGGRPAINDHARAHLGWLLAALALTLAWGYVLEPYELIAGIPDVADPSTFAVVSVVSPALTGVALMVALLSGLWALRPRHALAGAGWVVLVFASLVGHYIVPALVAGGGSTPRSSTALRRLTDAAYGMEQLRESPPIAGASDPRGGATLSLWREEMLRAADSTQVVSVDPATLSLPAGPVAVWLIGRARTDGALVLDAVLDGEVTATGGPLYLRAGDSVAYPLAQPVAVLPRDAARPGAPRYLFGPREHGPAVGAWPRRAALAWALQAGELLGAVAPATRLAWTLAPRDRLATVAPFAEWRPARAALVDGRVVWLSDGYVSARGFPLVEPTLWMGRLVTMVRAGFLGVVDAETGATRVILRRHAGPVAEAWADLAAFVEQPGAITSGLARAVGYPAELLMVQARALESDEWSIGTLLGRGDSTRGDPLPPSPVASGAGRAPALVAGFERAHEGRLSAVLMGRAVGDDEVLTLTRIDSTGALPRPEALIHRWHRFVTFEQLRDSVSGAGGHLELGPVRLWVADRTVGAYEVAYARGARGTPAVVWISVAIGSHLGAGRSTAEAWANLRGASAPLPPGTVRGQLDDARHWLRRADSALRRGDLPAFGRAFDALKSVLDLPPASGVR